MKYVMATRGDKIMKKLENELVHAMQIWHHKTCNFMASFWTFLFN